MELPTFFNCTPFDNNTVNSFAPNSTDAIQYSGLAETFKEQNDFAAAFNNGYRTPGYPVILYLCSIFSSKPLLAARFLNLLLVVSMIPFLYFALRKITGEQLSPFVISFLCLIWIPFYYFVPILISESISLFFIAVTIFLLASFFTSRNFVFLAGIGVSLAILVYLKPNHILLALPVSLFIWMASKKKRLINTLTPIGLMAILVLPWTLFISISNNTS